MGSICLLLAFAFSFPAHLVEQSQIFVDGGLGLVMVMAKDRCTHALQRDYGSGRKFNGDTRSREQIYDGLSDRVVASRPRQAKLPKNPVFQILR